MPSLRGPLFALALATSGRSPEPLLARAQLDPAPAGAQCAEGGLVAHFGVDLDRDGTLTVGEIDLSSYVCSGPATLSPAPPHEPRVAGLGALLSLQQLPPRGYCAAGGLSVSVGLDQDSDGQLDEQEISDVEHLCAGAKS